mmetsp:Transcript_15607/g.31638  ORF Transcript_15607/g.31638 Transcript_15607/m.31638 type:complete len:223 (-) Transcript_15607:275-943(-)
MAQVIPAAQPAPGRHGDVHRLVWLVRYRLWRHPVYERQREGHAGSSGGDEYDHCGSRRRSHHLPVADGPEQETRHCHVLQRDPRWPRIHFCWLQHCGVRSSSCHRLRRWDLLLRNLPRNEDREDRRPGRCVRSVWRSWHVGRPGRSDLRLGQLLRPGPWLAGLPVHQRRHGELQERRPWQRSLGRQRFAHRRRLRLGRHRLCHRLLSPEGYEAAEEPAVRRG